MVALLVLAALKPLFQLARTVVSPRCPCLRDQWVSRCFLPDLASDDQRFAIIHIRNCLRFQRWGPSARCARYPAHGGHVIGGCDREQWLSVVGQQEGKV